MADNFQVDHDLYCTGCRLPASSRYIPAHSMHFCGGMFVRVAGASTTIPAGPSPVCITRQRSPDYVNRREGVALYILPSPQGGWDVHEFDQKAREFKPTVTHTVRPEHAHAAAQRIAEGIRE